LKKDEKYGSPFFVFYTMDHRALRFAIMELGTPARAEKTYTGDI
jgi:hypothetical protein